MQGQWEAKPERWSEQAPEDRAEKAGLSPVNMEASGGFQAE